MRSDESADAAGLAHARSRWASNKSLDSGARRVVMSAEFFDARRLPSSLLCKLKNLFRRLDALLRFQEPQKIKRAELDDPRAFAHHDAPQNRRFFT